MNNNVLANKIAVVTGACGGIGSALITNLSQNGVYCLMVDRCEKPNSDQAVLINQNRGSFFTVDLTDEDGINKFIKDVTAKFNRIDYLYNIAGIGIYKNISDLTVDEWKDSININLTVPFILTKKLLNILGKSETPLVFNIGSGMGTIPSIGRSAYCASKFGLRGLTLSLAKEYKKKKIKFQLLTLGSVMTNFGSGGIEHRMALQKAGKRYLTPEEVVEKIVQLTLDRESPAEVEFYPVGYEEGDK